MVEKMYHHRAEYGSFSFFEIEGTKFQYASPFRSDAGVRRHESHAGIDEGLSLRLI